MESWIEGIEDWGTGSENRHDGSELAERLCKNIEGLEYLGLLGSSVADVGLGRVYAALSGLH